jgi:hypothetical protein
MLGAQYSSITFTNYLMISFLAVNTCNMDQIGNLLIYLINGLANYFLNDTLTLKENDLLSPSVLNGYAVCIK